MQAFRSTVSLQRFETRENQSCAAHDHDELDGHLASPGWRLARNESLSTPVLESRSLHMGWEGQGSFYSRDVPDMKENGESPSKNLANVSSSCGESSKNQLPQDFHHHTREAYTKASNAHIFDGRPCSMQSTYSIDSHSVNFSRPIRPHQVNQTNPAFQSSNHDTVPTYEARGPLDGITQGEQGREPLRTLSHVRPERETLELEDTKPIIRNQNIRESQSTISSSAEEHCHEYSVSSAFKGLQIKDVGGKRVAAGFVNTGSRDVPSHWVKAAENAKMVQRRLNLHSKIDVVVPNKTFEIPPSNEVLNRMATSTMAKTKATLKPVKTLKLHRTRSGRLVLPVERVQTPEDYLQFGIQFHENGELERAAYYFEQSAKRNGGCGTGYLMYGLTLRHGWGCREDAALGFKYLQKAAEHAVSDVNRFDLDDLQERASQEESKLAKNELIMALHEIGTSFRFGWGVAKDKKMGVKYFEMAANLGDADAQQDLAYCCLKGQGCAKDKKKAAKYYQLAIAQGAEVFGMSWIYKDKYMESG